MPGSYALLCFHDYGGSVHHHDRLAVRGRSRNPGGTNGGGARIGLTGRDWRATVGCITIHHTESCASAEEKLDVQQDGDAASIPIQLKRMP
jgi:hypothetical protein